MGHIRSFFELVGRACIAILFIGSGVGKIFAWDHTLAEMNLQLIPYSQLALFLATCIEIFCGLGLLLGWHMRLSATLLALYLIPVSYFFHGFWLIADPTLRAMQFIQFGKNLGIFGGLLCLAAGPGNYRVDSTD